MKRKRWIITTVTLILMGSYGAAIYGQGDNQLNQWHLENLNEAKNIKRIADSVLENTGREDLYDLEDVEDVKVYYGSVLGAENEDVVISVSFGPKNTVVAVYTSDGNVYEYVGDVGNFFDVQNIEFIPIPSLGKDVVIVQEFANQNIGVYEASSLIKGYVYEDTAFKNVLNTPAKIQASWNFLLDNEDIADKSKWRRITEDTERIWKNRENPNLQLSRNQTYLEARDVDTKQQPKDTNFTESDTRRVVEIFYWSDEWRRFIIGEAVEKATGKPVAVIEDQTASAYTLAGFKENGYRILREDGTQEVVKENQLEWIKKPNVEEIP